MPRWLLPMMLACSLPMTVSAKKHAATSQTQLADAGFSDLDLQALPKETIHLGKSTKKKGKSSKKSKRKATTSPSSLNF